MCSIITRSDLAPESNLVSWSWCHVPGSSHGTTAGRDGGHTRHRRAEGKATTNPVPRLPVPGKARPRNARRPHPRLKGRELAQARQLRPRDPQVTGCYASRGTVGIPAVGGGRRPVGLPLLDASPAGCVPFWERNGRGNPPPGRSAVDTDACPPRSRTVAAGGGRWCAILESV